MPEPKQYSKEELNELAQKEAELQSQIKEIQSFIKEAPEKLQKAEEERIQTLPAPDEITQRRREVEFFDRLSRGELKNERRHQAKNGVLFALLFAALIAVCLWIYRYVT